MNIWILLSFVAVAAAQSDLDCNFNSNNIDKFCKWSNDPNNWLVKWNKVIVGPNDRSLCLRYPIESKLVRMARGKVLTARMWSTVIFTDTKLGCLKFNFKLDGMVQGMKLTMMRREMGSCQTVVNSKGNPSVTCDNVIIWKSLSDGSYNRWNDAFITLTKANSTDFKLILEGTIPSGNPKAKICVDNITSSDQPCKLPETKQQKAPSYNSWVELYGMTFAGALALGLTIPIAVFVVCLFERKRKRGKKNKRIIRHADELDMPEGMNTVDNSYEASAGMGNSASGSVIGPMGSGSYSGSQQQLMGVGNPRLMGRAMSTPSAGINGQGGNYTMGKRASGQGMGPRTGSGGQMGTALTMGRGAQQQQHMDSGWMMSSQHGDLMENDEYTIDPDYTTHRQMSVPPPNGYIPAASGQVARIANTNPGAIGASRPPAVPPPQPQIGQVVNGNNNPFGTPTVVSSAAQGGIPDNRSINAGGHVSNFGLDDGAAVGANVTGNNNSRGATPGLPFYPPRYEEAMGFNHGGQQQPQTMEEKPPLLPPRIPDGVSNSSGGPSGSGTSGNSLGATVGCSTPLPPAPPPLPISGHPSAAASGKFDMPPPQQ